MMPFRFRLFDLIEGIGNRIAATSDFLVPIAFAWFILMLPVMFECTQPPKQKHG
ncbi:hypothetical protein ACFLZC_02770 [Patescibacteria group bacterium]